MISARQFLKALSKIAVGGTVLATIGSVLWWRKNPSPCPYSQRWSIHLPRPIISRAGLHEILDPQATDRILEIGPGTGYYTLDVALQLDQGTLHALDIQHTMLAYLRDQARERGIANIEPVHGDAKSLPYPDDYFDAVYLVTVLGEITNQQRALQEINRVLKPGGQLVVGEQFPDPHFVTFESSWERASRERFQFVEKYGGHFGYFAHYLVPPERAD